jgi:hypothetical protein
VWAIAPVLESHERRVPSEEMEIRAPSGVHRRAVTVSACAESAGEQPVIHDSEGRAAHDQIRRGSAQMQRSVTNNLRRILLITVNPSYRP